MIDTCRPIVMIQLSSLGVLCLPFCAGWPVWRWCH